jgi:hypothetical protein
MEEVDRMVGIGRLNSRSGIADRRLDYGEPFEYVHRDKEIATLEAELKQAKQQLHKDCDVLNQIIDDERAENTKLRTALERLHHLHLCEQEGIAVGQPTFEQWTEAVDNAGAALKGRD